MPRRKKDKGLDLVDKLLSNEEINIEEDVPSEETAIRKALYKTENVYVKNDPYNVNGANFDPFKKLTYSQIWDVLEKTSLGRFRDITSDDKEWNSKEHKQATSIHNELYFRGIIGSAKVDDTTDFVYGNDMGVSKQDVVNYLEKNNIKYLSKVEDVVEERVQTVIAGSCGEHPNYQGLRKPRNGCKKCQSYYEHNQSLGIKESRSR